MVKLDSICVYCGSAVGNSPRYAREAEHLGTLLAERGIRLVYGGGAIGLMGVVARAALAAGGEVVGVIPGFLDRTEKGLRAATRLEVVDSMHERKERMFALVDGVIVLPGGLGTLDETFEVLTWRQLQLHDKPIMLVDIDGYWQPLMQLVEHIVGSGFAPASALRLWQRVPSAEAALERMAAAPAPAVAPAAPERL